MRIVLDFPDGTLVAPVIELVAKAAGMGASVSAHAHGLGKSLARYVGDQDGVDTEPVAPDGASESSRALSGSELPRGWLRDTAGGLRKGPFRAWLDDAGLHCLSDAGDRYGVEPDVAAFLLVRRGAL